MCAAVQVVVSPPGDKQQATAGSQASLDPSTGMRMTHTGASHSVPPSPASTPSVLLTPGGGKRESQELVKVRVCVYA